MPIFEYKCNKCGKEFEELVGSSDEEVKCPGCGSSDVEKLFSLIARSCKCCGSSGEHT